MTTKPDAIQFKENIAKNLVGEEDEATQENTAKAIYQVIFAKNLAELDKGETKLLSVLLNSNISEFSSEIFKNIVQEYPETADTLRSIRRYKRFFPLTNGDAERTDWTETIDSDEETIKYICNVQANIFDLFANNSSNNEAINKARGTRLNNIVWDKLLQKVQKELGDSAYRNCKAPFRISKYDLENNQVILSTNTEEQYIWFDDYIIKLLAKIILTSMPELPGKIKFRYEIEQTSNSKTNNNSAQTPKDIYNKPRQNINFPLDEHISRDNCAIPNKEDIYKVITDTDKMSENVYIQAEQGAGKTHLSQAICKKLKEDFPKQKIVYIKGSDFLNKYLRSANLDRNLGEKASKKIYKNVNNFRDHFDNAKFIIIDDIEQIQGQKTSTQNIFKQITERTGAKIIMTSYLNMTEVIINKKVVLEEEGRGDYIRSSIPELFNPNLLKAALPDTKARKIIAERLLNTELFTPPASQGIIHFLAESNIPLNRFPAIFNSIKFNSNGNMVDNDPRTAFEIIKEMTGTIIKPDTSEILQTMLDAFNDEKIKQYVNVNEMGGFPKSEHIDDIKQVRGAGLSTTDGVLLRSAIFFIKKHYPKKTFDEIAEIFNRSNANTLYKEIADYLKDNKNLEEHLNSQIDYFLKKKYGLLEKDRK